MIKVFFPAFLLVISSCCMMKAKEIQGRVLMRPLTTQTVPPPLSYHGSDACFDYFSTPPCKYKVPRTEEIMPDSYRRPFISWREVGEKQKPGLSINKQGELVIMLFPVAGTHAVPLKCGPAETSGQPVFGKGGDSDGRKKQAVLPNSLPEATSNHGAKATY